LEHFLSAVRSTCQDLALPPTHTLLEGCFTLEPPPGVIAGNLLRFSRQFVDPSEDRQKCRSQFRQLHGAPAHEEFTT
jgi:hypothetical protein